MMTVKFDSFIPLITVALVAVAYLIRVALKGRVSFERIDQQGGGPFLSKSIMEMGYWGMQPLARLLVYFEISANAVSSVSCVFGAAAGVCLGLGHFGTAGILAGIAGVLDALDGMVARKTGTVSLSGKVLDSTLDRYVEFFFLGGLVVYYREIPSLQILTLFALLGSFMVSYSSALAEIFGIQLTRGSMRRADRLVYLIGGAILSSITMPWIEARWSLPVPPGIPMVAALTLVAVVANLSALERARTLRRVLRDRSERERLTRAS